MKTVMFAVDHPCLNGGLKRFFVSQRNKLKVSRKPRHLRENQLLIDRGVQEEI